MSRRPRIAISLGDPCGIGPELLLRALPEILAESEVLVVGARAGVDLLNSPEAFWRWVPAGLQGEGAQLQIDTSSGPVTAPWLDPTPDIRPEALQLGIGSATSGRATVEAIKVAAGLALAREVDALVTLPMAKAAAHLAGYDLPGHTEFLQTLAGAPITRMAFVSPRLCVVLHSVHQSLRSVVEELDAKAVAETLAFSAHQFIRLTGQLSLRVALCALNPHAGESGAFGHEEDLLVEALTLAEARFRAAGPDGPFPTLPSPFPAGPAPKGWHLYPEQAKVPAAMGTREIPRFSGPHPSDSLFHRAVSGEFDLVVALYHDQGLIPIKLLEPTRAVNLTLGLPYIRTSPDHGTAFDKAGAWVADPSNFLEAFGLARRLAERARPDLRSGLPAAW